MPYLTRRPQQVPKHFEYGSTPSQKEGPQELAGSPCPSSYLPNRTRLIMIKKIPLFLLLLLISIPSFAADKEKKKGSLLSFETNTKEFQLVPVPIFETRPDEGNSYGLMPVLIMSDKGEDAIKGIMALMAQYNTVTSFDLAGLVYLYPEPEREITFFVEQALKYAREITVGFSDPHIFNDKYYLQGLASLIKTPFGRFYGLGPDRTEKNQSNFVARNIKVEGTVGRYVLKDLRVNYGFKLHSTDILNRAIEEFDDTLTRYGALPQVSDSTNFIHEFSVAFDNRPEREYSTHGSYVEGKYFFSAKDLGSDKNFQGVSIDAVQLVPLVQNRLTAAMRFNLQQIFGNAVPFYELSQLGGSNDLRGFTSGRFVDRGRMFAQVEARIKALSMNLLDTKFDIYIDPFFEVGRVFDSVNHLGFAKWQPVGGIGFRLFVPPNVVGRLDAAFSSDGLSFYTELGYPF